LGLVRAGLAGSEVLQCLRGIKDVTGVDAADDRANFRICGDASTRRKANEQSGQCNDEQQAAIDQHSPHCGSPL